MATIHVRDIPDDVYAALRKRAGRAGRSMSAELRKILTEAVQPKPSLEQVVREIEEIRRSFAVERGGRGFIERALAKDRGR
jgi:plasmid stability protein